MPGAMSINPKDNVAVALEDLTVGSEVSVAIGSRTAAVQLKQDIPFGHKLALKDIAKGEAVTKYGETIGKASTAIAAGEHVHIHNVEGTRGRGDLEKAVR